MEILEVKNLKFLYPTRMQPTLREVSFTVKAGEFVVLCGDTGSGKTTLLRLLKKELSPRGIINGEILFDGCKIENVDSERIGYVMQQPDEQIVTDKVYSELAFGLENMGVSQSVIASRIAEISSYFGIEDWYDRDVFTLSGGQKQLLNLAAIMVMSPDILILDEPTSQLDPISTSNFFDVLKKLNNDFSTTIIIVEHRLEELMQMCDRMLIMSGGRIVENGEPRTVVAKLNKKSKLQLSIPTAARLYHTLYDDGECPLTVREGRRFIESNYRNDILFLEDENYIHSDKKALEFKDVYFRYERTLPDVLNGLNLTVYENEIFCILGGNGSGKTTALSCASGVLKIYSGQIRVFGKKLKAYDGQSLYHNCLTLLPQDVQSVFLHNTVREELKEVNIDIVELPFDLYHLLDIHPFDLSGGEQQLVALIKILASNPQMILMDEPTKGLDPVKKHDFIEFLKKLRSDNITLIIVTHDVEFAAMCADRCALFFRGDIVSVGTPREFFSGNSFYTTAASRMTKGYYQNTVTIEDIVELCLKNGKRYI